MTIAVDTNNDKTEVITFETICNDRGRCYLDDCFGRTSSALAVVESDYYGWAWVMLYFIDQREETKSFYVNVTSGDIKFSLPTYNVNSK